jgi:hypothetical protein
MFLRSHSECDSGKPSLALSKITGFVVGMVRLADLSPRNLPAGIEFQRFL